MTKDNVKNVYLGVSEGEFKKIRYYNHKQFFQNKDYKNNTTLPTYLWHSSQRVFIPPFFDSLPPLPPPPHPLKKIFNPPPPFLNIILPNPKCSYADCFS